MNKKLVLIISTFLGLQGCSGGGSTATSALKKAAPVVVASPSPSASPLACQIISGGCDKIIGTGSGGIWEDGRNVASNFYYGKTLCIKAGNYSNGIGFYQVLGTSTQPVKIINCGGQVTAQGGPVMRIDASRYIKLLGNGDPNHKYGIKLGPMTNDQSFLDLSAGTSDVEIAHIEIAGADANTSTLSGYAGIAFRTYPNCTKYQRHQFEIQNVKIHDNYIHNVGGEGFYVGQSHHGWINGAGMTPGFKNVDCTASGGSANSTLIEADVNGAWIENNILENIGRDGIQVAGVINGNMLIANNIIKNWAAKGEWGHNGGIMVNPGSKGIIRNNYLENPSSNKNGDGLVHQGIGDTQYINNIIIGANAAIQVLRNTDVCVAMTTGPIEFYNNTIISYGNAYPIYHFCQNLASYKLINTLVVGSYTAQYINAQFIGANGNVHTCLSQTTNLFYHQLSDVNFVNAAAKDFHLNGTSPAVHAGTPFLNVLTHDYDGTLRSTTQPSVGAYE